VPSKYPSKSVLFCRFCPLNTFSLGFELVLLDPEGRSVGVLDPDYGRFTLECRANKDEVPMPWGSFGKQVNERKAKATHVAAPKGFEDRFCTMDLCVDGNGYLLAIAFIFFGSGKKVEHYNDSSEVVSWYQKKAWKDGSGEMEWYRRVLRPHLLAKGLIEKGFLLQHDNVKPHHDYRALQYASNVCKVLSINPPPDSTPYIQPIDDNIGNMVRADILEIVNGKIEAQCADYPWTPREKRKIFVDAGCETVLLWRHDERRLGLTQRAVIRCGLTFAVSGLVPLNRLAVGETPKIIGPRNVQLQPVRFLPGFGISTSDSTHAAYNDLIPFQPFLPKGTTRFDPLFPHVDAPVPKKIAPKKAAAKIATKMAKAKALKKAASVSDDSESSGEGPDDDNFDEFDFGASYREEEYGEQIDDRAEDDEGDKALQNANFLSKRGCLPGCFCEDAEKTSRCGCFSKYDGCADSCLCKCSNAKGPAPLASRVEDMVDIDNALGDEEILAVLSHEVEDEALYFQVSWMSGETSEEPLENLIEPAIGKKKEAVVNIKLKAYAAAVHLDLAPFIKVMVAIWQGKELPESSD
jgi:hypothetical protein